VAVIIASIDFVLEKSEELVAFAWCIDSKLSICDLSCLPSVQSALSSQVLFSFLGGHCQRSRMVSSAQRSGGDTCRMQ
jgi:hypothetical protein